MSRKKPPPRARRAAKPLRVMPQSGIAVPRIPERLLRLARHPALPPLIALLGCVIFVLMKFFLLEYRFGDGNAYLFDAYLVSKGKIPYRDFFLADFPVQILFLTLLRPFFAFWLKGYQLVPVGVEAITAWLLYLLLKRRKNPLAPLAPFLHLWSFTVLSTSDFITGVQLTTMFCVIGWYLWDTGRPAATGFAFALSFLTKMYALPACAAFGCASLMKQHFALAWRLFVGTLLTMVVVLLPLLVLAFDPMLRQAVLMHFNRPQGIDKVQVLGFFFKKEWALLILTLPGLWFLRRERLALALLFSIVFFAMFQDLYYVYLDFFMPFMVMAALTAIYALWRLTKFTPVLSAIAIIILAVNLVQAWGSYFGDFQKRGIFSNAEEIAASLAALPEHLEIYGSHEVAPLVALLAGRGLFQNHTDTNTQLFAAGALDREAISRAAVDQGIYLMARIMQYPQYGYFDRGYEGVFSPTLFASSCHRALTFPSTAGESDNEIVAYRCAKN